MTFGIIIDALSLPQSARVDKRVPKKLLLEQSASTAADRRIIQDSIEEMQWVAALKPISIGVQEYRDAVREYQEIAILTVDLRATAKMPRIIQLIHRAIPYPLLLVAKQAEAINLSVAHKRWSQGETGKVVIEELRRTPAFRPDTPDAAEGYFLGSLALSTLPAGNLFCLYQGWLDRVTALEAAIITGVFNVPDTLERSTALHEGLINHANIRRQLNTLRAQATKEKQVNRRVELNIEIKKLENNLASIGHELANREN